MLRRWLIGPVARRGGRRAASTSGSHVVEMDHAPSHLRSHPHARLSAPPAPRKVWKNPGAGGRSDEEAPADPMPPEQQAGERGERDREMHTQADTQAGTRTRSQQTDRRSGSHKTRTGRAKPTEARVDERVGPFQQPRRPRSDPSSNTSLPSCHPAIHQATAATHLHTVSIPSLDPYFTLSPPTTPRWLACALRSSPHPDLSSQTNPLKHYQRFSSTPPLPHSIYSAGP